MLTAFRKTVTIKAGGRIEIKSSELTPGSKAEVIVLIEKPSEINGSNPVGLATVKALFKETQALPQVKVITEDDIVAEIEAYRIKQ